MKVTVLIADDLNVNVKQLRSKCCAWNDVECDVLSAADLDDAKNQFGKNIDLAFIDLDFKYSTMGQGSGALSGLDIISELRGKFAETYIVAYSVKFGKTIDFGQLTGEHRDIYESCLARGANKVIAGERLVNFDPIKLRDELADFFSKSSAAPSNVSFIENHETMAALESIEKEQVCLCINRQIGKSYLHTVRALGGGYSGSVLFCVESVGTMSSQSKLKTVIKFFPSSANMREEFHASPRLGSHLDRYSLTLDDTNSVEYSGGWRAVKMSQVLGAVDLKTWLSSGNSDENSVVDRITDLLISADSKGEHADKNVADAAVQRTCPFNYRLLVEINQIIENVVLIREIIPPPLIADWSSIATLLENIVENRIGILTRPTVLVDQHGDFHCGNIFIGERGNIDVIDYGRGGTLPRFIDCATLLVDLFVGEGSVRGNAEIHWRDIENDLVRLLSYWPFDHAAPYPAWRIRRLRIYKAIGEGIRSGFPADVRNEFLDAIFVALLRYIRFGNVSIHRKALCLRLLGEIMGIVGRAQ